VSDRMATNTLTRLRAKARLAPQRVVLPESGEENILRRARAADQGLHIPVARSSSSDSLHGRRVSVVDLWGSTCST
jgi:hypothetical protein